MGFTPTSGIRALHQVEVLVKTKGFRRASLVLSLGLCTLIVDLRAERQEPHLASP